MTSDDFKKLRSVVKEEVVASEKRTQAKIVSSEQRLYKKIVISEKRTRAEIAASARRINNDFGDFVDQNLLPLIAEKADKADVERLEGRLDGMDRKLDLLLDKNMDHEGRIKRIESTQSKFS